VQVELSLPRVLCAYVVLRARAWKGWFEQSLLRHFAPLFVAREGSEYGSQLFNLINFILFAYYKLQGSDSFNLASGGENTT
jgi:hypothetical protein